MNGPHHDLILKGLPSEIIFQFIQLLPAQDAYQCMFVCKAWYPSAIVRFYDHLALDKTKLQILRPHLSIPTLLKGGEDLFKYGHLVKTLTIHNDKAAEICPHIFLKRFLTYLPSLKTINLSNSSEIRTYLQTLYDEAVNEYNTASRPIEQIKVFRSYDPYSDKNYCPGYRSLIKTYVNACFQYRNTLKYLELHDLNDNNTILQFSSKESTAATHTPLDILQYFPSLSHLTISGNQLRVNNGGINESVIDFLIRNCRNLETFELLNYYNNSSEDSIPDGGDNNEENEDPLLATRLSQNLEEEHLRQVNQISIAFNPVAMLPFLKDMALLLERTEKDYSSAAVLPQPTIATQLPATTKLKNFTLLTPYFPLSQLEGIIRNIPLASLQSLTLVMNRSSPFEWFTRVGIDNALKFALHLRQIKNLQLHFNTSLIAHSANVLVPPLPPQEQDDCIPIQEQRIRFLLWSFVHIIRGSRDLDYSIQLDVSAKPIILQPDVKISVQESNGLVNLTESITLDSFLHPDAAVHNCHHNDEEDISAPSSFAFHHGVLRNTRYLTVNTPLSDCIKELNAALTRFPQLARLTIHSQHDHPSMVNRGYAIECSSDNYSSSLVKAPPQQPLTRLTLKRVSLTRSFIDTVTSLLPDIRDLTLTDCDFYDDLGWISRKTTLDLRDLVNLKSLSLTIQTITSSYKRVIVSLNHYTTEGLYIRSFRSTEDHCHQYSNARGAYRHATVFQKYHLNLFDMLPFELKDSDTLFIDIKLRGTLDTLNFYISDYTPQDVILQ